ncbi:MAG: DUF5058 family protein [Ruminococcaceae bacterium]|nr:DUF5058 family protein [Oscillospiraceae bacterium]
MEFNINSPILFVMVGILILVVLGQSVFFLCKALKRSKELGMDKKVIKKTISSSAVFTVAPAVAILVGVITLSKSLGIALPWLRLSVIGSLTYETVAAGTALEELGLGLEMPIVEASDFVTVVFVMTTGIIIGLLLVPFVTKKIQKGMNKIEMKDKKWGEILNNAMFLGMISAFLGYVFCDVANVFHGDTSGLIPVCVMAVSAVVMMICGLLSRKLKQRWITDYALPISLVCGMASAIPFTAWLR